VVRFAFERLFRDLYVSSFYRKHPAVMNVLNVLFECWNLSISIGLMLARSFKLLLVSAVYIGRIDVPTFSPGVGYVGPYPLDSEHFNFKKDLLIHEAVSSTWFSCPGCLIRRLRALMRYFSCLLSTDTLIWRGWG